MHPATIVHNTNIPLSKSPVNSTLSRKGPSEHPTSPLIPENVDGALIDCLVLLAMTDNLAVQYLHEHFFTMLFCPLTPLRMYNASHLIR